MKRSEINSSFQWDAAHNATVWSGGREYIDFTSGIFTANLGHNNPAVNQAVADVLAKQGPHSYTYGLPLRDEYIRRLCEWSGFEHAHLFTTGSEAVEAAMRVCWHLGYDADDFHALPGTFHGKTWGPDKILRRIPEDFGFDFAPKDVAVVEGYRGWDCRFWTPGEISSVRQAGIVIVDEIQSGFYRTGRRFAHHWYDLKPDMAVIGKAQGNGFPVSAVLANGRCAQVLCDKTDDFSSTHGGNPVACAAGLAVLEEFAKNPTLGVWGFPSFWTTTGYNGSGAVFVAAIHAHSAPLANQIVLKCREKGLLVVHTGKASVKIGPPLTIDPCDLDAGLAILKEVLAECAT